MSITIFQRDLCRLIAANRRRSGESYVAGGVALNTFLKNVTSLTHDLSLGEISYHAGRICGVWPTVKPAT